MPEVVIKYKSPKTLEALKDLSKYFDFIITPKEKKKEKINREAVTIIQGRGTVDNAEMNEIFTRNKFNAKELRSKWQRKQ